MEGGAGSSLFFPQHCAVDRLTPLPTHQVFLSANDPLLPLPSFFAELFLMFVPLTHSQPALMSDSRYCRCWVDKCQ